MPRTISNRRSTRVNRTAIEPRARRRSLARLRSAYFARAWELASHYGVTFDRMVLHLWRARRMNPRWSLRQATNLEDLVMAIACVDNCSRAWADFAHLHERTLARRCRDCADELEALVEVRRHIANMRRDALAGRSALQGYVGVKPLRTWAGEIFQRSRLQTRRAAFALDPADSCYGAPLRFTPTGADG